MAYETGTATDYLDLFEKLRTFLTTDSALVAAGQEWTELKYVGGTAREMYLRGQGNAGTDEIYVNISTYEDPPNSLYRWTLRGATGFNSSLPIASQPGSNAQARFLALWNNSIKYWFIANGRCFKVIAKVSTTYHAMYGGFGLPYATASEYPYPLMIGGSVSTNSQNYTLNTDAARNFWSPGVQSAAADAGTLAMLRTDGVWLSCANERANTGTSISALGHTAPYMSVMGTFGGSFTSDRRLRPSIDGTFALVPISVYAWSGAPGGANCYMELDGVFYVSGFGNTAENVITIGGVDYLVVPNVFRTGEDDYAAFKLEA